MATIDEILAQKKPATIDVSVRLTQDGDADERVMFTFRAIGRRAWEALLGDYPPTDEQQAEYEAAQAKLGVPPEKFERLDWDPDRFPPAIIAASCADPEITLEQAQALWDSDAFNTPELTHLFRAAVMVNTMPRGQVEWGKGSAAAPPSVTSSTSRANTASPGRSSSAGPGRSRANRSGSKKT